MLTDPRLRRLAPAGLLLLLALSWRLVPAGQAETNPLPDTLTVLVAVVEGTPVDYSIADAALHEADLAVRWLEASTGRRFRRGLSYARIVEIPGPSMRYAGEPELSFSLIRTAVLAQENASGIFPLVLADVQTQAGLGRRTCGMGGQRGVVMFLQNCPGDELRLTAVWPSAVSLTIAHELLHGLGAVPDCAPHATGGHVADDPADVMVAVRPQMVPGRAVTLDAGRDDYFGHGRPDCPDIVDSPLWLPEP